MNFEEWGEDTAAEPYLQGMYADWKAERVKLIGALKDLNLPEAYLRAHDILAEAKEQG